MSLNKKEGVRNSAMMLRNYMERKEEKFGWVQRKPEAGQYARMMKEHKKEDVKCFRNFLRMDYELYQDILQRIEGRISKKE